MNIEEAEVIFSEIQELATKVELDEELKKIDERYSISASWIDTDVSNITL